MLITYFGIIHKQPDSVFGVSFPDFPGCISATEELADIPAAAKEALEFHVAGMVEDGMELPVPRSLADILSEIE
jgi:predicted RNase H-like HicB family nuclease